MPAAILSTSSDGAGVNITVDYFVADSMKTIGVSASKDLNNFSDIPTSREVYVFGKNDYDFFDAVRLRGTNIPDDSKYLKISLDNGVQISRIEITIALIGCAGR